MRILHVLDHSVPLQSGYAFRTYWILKHQRALGLETFHLTSPKHTRPYVPEEKAEGWTFFRTPPISRLVRRVPFLREFCLMRATAKRLRAVVDQVRPDVIHAHSPVLNALPAVRVGKAMGIPVVYEVRAFWEDAAVSHGTYRFRGLRYALARALETQAMKRADAVIAICEGIRRDMLVRGIPAEKVTVVPNAANVVEPTSPAPADPALLASLGLEGKKVLGYFGSFYSYEGLDLLIGSLPQVLQARPDVKLLLVGGGPEEERLRARVARADLEDAVVFTGRVPHEEVPRYYALTDVLVYPRHPMRLTELVTPLKALEALALGKVVVASDVGGHRELIRDGDTGSLFRAGDAGELADTILRVLGNRERWPEQGERARRFVRTERSWPQIVKRYSDVYGRFCFA